MFFVRGMRPLTIVRVGTRGSRLALAQTETVVQELKERNPGIETAIVVIKTSGDQITAKLPAEAGGKGLFVKEIEDALLKREIDVAVHSMKDVPGALPQGLGLAAIPKRLQPWDAFVADKYRHLADLPPNARVGTGSVRRKAALLRYRADLKIVPIRGNVDTRLQKLDRGEVDALILACAGLERLGLTDRLSDRIDTDIMLPAAGQGALALETRLDDHVTNRLVKTLHDAASAACVMAERAFMQALGADCDIPAAALAEINGGNIVLTGAVYSLNGIESYRESVSGPESLSLSNAQNLAQRLLAMGADKILAAPAKNNLC